MSECLPQMPRASTPCSHPLGNNSVSTGPEIPTATSAMPIPTFMVVASAGNPAMVPDPASPIADPQCVVTPLNPSPEEILCKYNLTDAWTHIIVGLREDFNTGISWRGRPFSLNMC